MALKQLMINKKIEQRKADLEQLQTRSKELETRESELVVAIDEAETEEEVSTVEGEIEKLEGDKTDNEEKKSTLEREIAGLEAELEEIRSKMNHPKPQPKTQERNDNIMNRLQVRELLRTGEYYQRSEVKDFYEKFKNIRAVSGGEVTIPDIVINRIMDIVGDYSTLYPLVDKITAKGTARILIDTDTTAATWLEMKGKLPTGDVGTVTYVDFDGFKVGKVTFVDNCMLDDSVINLDEYVTKKLARSIGMALDLAILKGEGSANKQPDGIIPKLPEGNTVQLTSLNSIADVVKAVGKIDTGEDSVGEIVGVMKRSTYYDRFLQFSVQVNAQGNVVGKLLNLTNPDLLGLRVVFNNNMNTDEVLFGDFKQYTLVEREDITIDKSEHAKFTEDQTGFRGKARFDGKPVKEGAFVLVKLPKEGEPVVGE